MLAIGPVALAFALVLTIASVEPPAARAATPGPRAPGPPTAQVDGRGPGIIWRRAVDRAGDPILADGTLRPLSLDHRRSGTVLVTEDGSHAVQLWLSPDEIVWQRLADLPRSDPGTRVREVVAYAKGWVVHGEDVDGQAVVWVSSDGIEWRRITDDKLEPFDGAFIDDILAAGDGLVAVGRDIDSAGNDRMWTSPNGRRWRERRDFAKKHPGASIDALGAMGYHVVSFGRTATGKATAWVAPDDRLNYVARQWRGSAPADAGLPTTLLVGSDAGVAIVPASAPGDEPELWRSLNSWDWRRLPSKEHLAPGGHTAYASDGDLIVADHVTASGTHGLEASSDGVSWQELRSDGDIPDTSAQPLLATHPAGLVLASADGVWSGAWVDRSAAFSPRPAYSQPAVGPIGADPRLRKPVLRPKGRRPTPDIARPPTARVERGGVRLEHWLPTGRARNGRWIPAHVRITNTGTRSITFACGGGSTVAQTAKLFPRGKRWSGNAATFKKQVLEREWPGNLAFGWRRGDGTDCPGSVGLDIKLPPRGVYEYDVWGVPRYPIADQPLPSGRLPVVTTFSYRSGDRDARRTVAVRTKLRFVGPRWRWATPQDMVDAMLEDLRFSDWLDRRDRPIWWTHPTFHVVDTPDAYWPSVGFEGPAPDGTVSIGLFADSWDDFGGGYGRMLLDPWTGQILGFAR